MFKIKTKKKKHLKLFLIVAVTALLLLLPAAVYAAEDNTDSGGLETSCDYGSFAGSGSAEEGSYSDSSSDFSSSDSDSSTYSSTNFDGCSIDITINGDADTNSEDILESSSDSSIAESSSSDEVETDTNTNNHDSSDSEQDNADNSDTDDSANNANTSSSEVDAEAIETDNDSVDDLVASSDKEDSSDGECEADSATVPEDAAIDGSKIKAEDANDDSEANSYKVELTPDGLVDGEDTGKATEFTVTFTELNAITKLGSATLTIPEEFTYQEGYQFEQDSIIASDGKSWSGNLVNRILSLWADNEYSYLGKNEFVSANFTAVTPDDSERGIYEFKSEAWTEANLSNTGVSNDNGKVDNMAAGHRDPVVVVGHGISNADDLNDIRNNLDDYYVQNEDIDLSDYNSGKGWEPIGSEENPFTGVYHGNNKNISNLTIDRAEEDYVGLFGMLGNLEEKYFYNDGFIPMGSRIYSVSLQGVNVMGRFFVGGLVGRNEGYINNVSVTGDVVGLSAVGGIAGGSGPEIEHHPDGSRSWSYSSDLYFGQISSSTSDVNVLGFNSVGGIVGGTYGDVKNSFASGPVANRTDNYPQNVELWDHEAALIFGDGFGGIIGSLNGYGLAEASFATGDVQGNRYIGGLIGSISSVNYQWVNKTHVINIDRCYATGDVSSYFNDTWFYSHNSVGGLVGYNSCGFIQNSYAAGNVSGDFLLGGLVGHNDGIILNTYATGDISGSDGFTGGLVGHNDDTVANSYYDSETTGQNDTGKGVAKTTSEMKIGIPAVDIYDKWDSAVWTFSTNEYPTIGTDPDPPEQQMSQTHNFPGGDGSKASPYEVASVEDLIAINFYPDAHFLQTDNIDLQSTDWQPIGNRLEPFTGTYDGDGFLISNLIINEPNLNYGGLFGYVGKTAELNNINLSDIDIIGNNYIGGLAGFLNGEFHGAYKPPIYNIDGELYRYDGATFIPYDAENDHEWIIDYEASVVNNSHSVGFIAGSSNVGGLVGYSRGMYMGGIGRIPLSEINSSSSSASVEGYSYIGGLVGYSDGIIYGSHASGFVTGLSSFKSYKGFDLYDQSFSVGGLVGYTNGLINNSYATGNVLGFRDVGGLAGSANHDVSNSSAYGNVIGYERVGGLIGSVCSEDTVINNCYAEGYVTGKKDINISPYCSEQAGEMQGSGYHSGSGSIGGLVGRNVGQVIDCHAIGTVIGITGVGGLTGVLLGDIASSHASGSVNGEWGVGGLVGINWLGSIHDSYSTSEVNGEQFVGQLIGFNYGFDSITGPSIPVGLMNFPMPIMMPTYRTIRSLLNQTILELQSIVNSGFISNGTRADLITARQAFGRALQQYNQHKYTLSAYDLAVVETSLAVTLAAIQALEVSLQSRAGETLDLEQLITVYNEAQAILNKYFHLLSSEQIVYTTTILAEIEELIDTLNAQKS